jgi:hypothetical protein
VVDASGQTVAAPITWEGIEAEGFGLMVAPRSDGAWVRANGIGRFHLVATSDGGKVDVVVVRVRSIEQALVSVAASSATSCGLDGQGRAYCWGIGHIRFVVGTGLVLTYAPAPLPGDVRFGQLGVGTSHGCGLALDGRAYCWGAHYASALGNSGGHSEAPVAVAGGRVYSSLSTGSSHSCALTPAGELYCWGANSGGQLGDGTRVRRLPRPARAGDAPQCRRTQPTAVAGP